MSSAITSIYPQTSGERDKWILSRRPARNLLDPRLPYAFFAEEECASNGEIVPVSTVFLTNRECPWRCVMCDLWRNTLTETLPSGAIPEQIDYALAQLPPGRQIKLYNSGSFFDPRAIPPEDYPMIASRLTSFERVIVESHPSLVGEGCLRFQELIKGTLEVAIGLETVEPSVLDRLNKRMTLEQFSSAGEHLRRNKIDLRAFILVQPPFMRADEALYWAERSLDFAFSCHATAATLIPTRGGNGAIDALAQHDEFSRPQLSTVEAAARYGLGVRRGRVFVDLWDIAKCPGGCSSCHAERIAALRKMNLTQTIAEPIYCQDCKWQA